MASGTGYNFHCFKLFPAVQMVSARSNPFRKLMCSTRLYCSRELVLSPSCHTASISCRDVDTRSICSYNLRHLKWFPRVHTRGVYSYRFCEFLCSPFDPSSTVVDALCLPQLHTYLFTRFSLSFTFKLGPEFHTIFCSSYLFNKLILFP